MNAADFVKAPGEAPAELDILVIGPTSSSWIAAACSASRNAAAVSPAATRAQAEIAPAPGQIAAIPGVPGMAVDQILVDGDGLLVKADRIGGSTDFLLDDADVGEGPGEGLLIARVCGVFAGELFLNSPGLLVWLAGPRRAVPESAG